MSAPRIKTINEFISCVKEFADGWTEIIYRGQSNEAYELDSSAARLLKKKNAVTRNQLFEYHKNMLSESQKLADARDSAECDFHQVAHLQHMGAKTGLLDYSHNPLVALFFACISSKEKDGAVYCFRHSTQYIPYIKKDDKLRDIFFPQSPSFITSKDGHTKGKQYVLTDIGERNHLKDIRLYLLAPPHINQRITAQQSIFLFPIKGHIEKHLHYTIIIAKDAKEELLAELRLLGISTKTLFPDTPGFAKWFCCKTGIEEYEQLLKDAQKDYLKLAKDSDAPKNNQLEHKLEELIQRYKLAFEPILKSLGANETATGKRVQAYALLLKALRYLGRKDEVQDLFKQLQIPESWNDKKSFEIYKKNFIKEDSSINWGDFALISSIYAQHVAWRGEFEEARSWLNVIYRSFEDAKDSFTKNNIAESCSEGLWILTWALIANTSSCSEKAIKECIKKLKELKNTCGENQLVAESYCWGFALLTEKQCLKDAMNNIKTIEGVYEQFRDNQYITHSYSFALAHLTYKQEPQDALNTINTLKELYLRFQDDENIATNLAAGLSCLAKKQNDKDAKQTVVEMQTLLQRFPDNESIASFLPGLPPTHEAADPR